MSLVTPGEGREDTRARAVYPAQDDAIRAVVHAFSAAEARLLVTGEDTPSAQRLVEISHEALIREWDLLKEWINDNRQPLRRREHIRTRMQQWEEEHKDQTLLLPPGLPLEEGRKLLDDPGDVLIEEVQSYITASIAADEERLRKGSSRGRTRVGGTFPSCQPFSQISNSTGGCCYCRNCSSDLCVGPDASRQKRGQEARVRQLAAQSTTYLQQPRPPQLSLLLAVEAVSTRRTGDGILPIAAAEEALRAALALPHGKPLKEGHTQSVWAVAFSRDGHWLASSSWDNTVRLWDMRNPTAAPAVLGGHAQAVWAVAFSHDNRWLASGS